MNPLSLSLSLSAPRVIFEIGVGNPSICRTRQWMGGSVRLELFEANVAIYQSLVSAFGHHPNVVIHHVALYDRDGTIEFSEDGDSSFVSEMLSPTAVCAPKEYVDSRQKVTVPCQTLAHYDKGDIDTILIDTEGSEWRILKTMVSRPSLIVLETHHGEKYQTPDIALIEEWMKDNGYVLSKRDVSDSHYMRSESP